MNRKINQLLADGLFFFSLVGLAWFAKETQR